MTNHILLGLGNSSTKCIKHVFGNGLENAYPLDFFIPIIPHLKYVLFRALFSFPSNK